MNDKPQTTLADVAQAAGVSAATVSRCLNNPDMVRPALKARVTAAIRRLDYVPHAAARSLASRKSRLIGAVLPSLDSALFGGALEAFQAEVSGSDQTLIVAASGYDRERERQQIRRFLASGVDALMLVGGHRDPAVYEALDRATVPYVLTWISGSDGPHPCVGFDNQAAGRQVARHLIDMGHRRIAVISGYTVGNDRAAARVRGVEEALGEKGLALPPAFLIQKPFGVDEGREAFRLLMERRPRPTAVICGAEPFAYGALFESQALGIPVPGQVSVTGFDDMWLAAHIRPALTTLRTPRQEIGRTAARYLLARLSGQETLPPRPLPVELVVRDSTAPPPTDL